MDITIYSKNFLGQLERLLSLHLNQSKLLGELPLSFQNLSNLWILDLSYNRLSSDIPTLIGTDFSSLTVLKLRSNACSGGLLFGLSNLTLLHILDLTKNNLSGSIPSTLGDLIAMSQKEKLSLSINASAYIRISITKVIGQDKLIVKAKNQDLEFAKFLPLIVSIDLSNNNFTGEFRNQITKLQSLVFLDLSRNHINGSIP